MAEGTEEVISVAELDRRLKRAVEIASGSSWVEGEIASLKHAASGHVYFCLKDEREDAIIDCVMYRLQALRARRYLAEGSRVQLRGRATVWAPRGRMQFVGDLARPAGRGALLEALERLKERLAAEGLFSPDRKRTLPVEPRVVGVVTSAAGAAFEDICSVAFRRGSARIVLSPAVVQGDAAVRSLIRAIDLLERYPGLDVLIIGRGGGSSDDLMAFNDERVVRRVAAVRVPVVSAVGHEIDTTLTDLAADIRAATPSQAAELVIPDARHRQEILERTARQLRRAMYARLARDRHDVQRLRAGLSDPRFLIANRQQQMDELRARLERQKRRLLTRRRALAEQLYRRLLARHPRAVLGRARLVISPLSARLTSAATLRLHRARAELQHAVARLDGLSPLSVLARGYAIAIGPGGQALRSAEQVTIGDDIELRLCQGRITAKVADVTVEPSSTRGES